MPDIAPATFDYGTLPEHGREAVRDCVAQIRVLMKRSVEAVLEIGRHLLIVKGWVGHGRFEDWFRAEFGLDPRTARNYMSAAKKFGKTETVSDLAIAPKAVYMISAPSVPESAVEEVVGRAKGGEEITPAKAKSVIVKHRARAAPAKGAAQQRDTAAALPGADADRQTTGGTPNVPTVRNCFGCCEDKPTIAVKFPGFAKNERTNPFADILIALCDGCRAAPINLLVDAVLGALLLEDEKRRRAKEQVEGCKKIAAMLREFSGPWDTEEALKAAQERMRTQAMIFDRITEDDIRAWHDE
jgi:hypothetical protein